MQCRNGQLPRVSYRQFIERSLCGEWGYFPPIALGGEIAKRPYCGLRITICQSLLIFCGPLCHKYTVPRHKISLQWRHYEQNGVSNHQPHDCLLNRLFRCRSKKTSKLRVTGLCVGNSPVTCEFPHKGPVTRKMFPIDDVIM